MSEWEATLIENLEQFTAFARKRVNDPELAADVVQESFLKALKSGDNLRENENVQAWFYRILRNSIIDLHRHKGVADRALEQLKTDGEIHHPDTAEEHLVCKCMDSLIPTLKPDYARLLRQIDLSGEEPESVAKSLNITVNNLNVRLYRARTQLKKRLEETCRLCSKHGCLNCTCDRPE